VRYADSTACGEHRSATDGRVGGNRDTDPAASVHSHASETSNDDDDDSANAEIHRTFDDAKSNATSYRDAGPVGSVFTHF
jgi:hypothetical protein